MEASFHVEGFFDGGDVIIRRRSPSWLRSRVYRGYAHLVIPGIARELAEFGYRPGRGNQLYVVTGDELSKRLPVVPPGLLEVEAYIGVQSLLETTCLARLFDDYSRDELGERYAFWLLSLLDAGRVLYGDDFNIGLESQHDGAIPKVVVTHEVSVLLDFVQSGGFLPFDWDMDDRMEFMAFVVQP